MENAMVMVVGQPAELTAFDPDARLERACELIVDAGQAGAHWIIFPEAYLPGGPTWLWSGLPDDATIGALHTMALAHAVVIPGAVSDRLCRVARRGRVSVVIGLVERANDTCYSSLLLIDEHGHICRHYRDAISSMNRQQSWSSVARITAMLMDEPDVPQGWAGGI
jgi:nitrilase